MPALPPEDRLWRHPSEVAQAARARRRAAHRIRSDSAAIVLVAGMISVALAAATFALVTGAGTSGSTVEVAAAAEPAWLGIQAVEVDDAECESLGIAGGVSVVDMATDGPAMAAGLRKGDVLMRLAGSDVHTMDALLDELRRHRAGDRVVIDVHRDGERRRIAVTLRKRG